MYVDTAILFCEYLNLHYRCRETVFNNFTSSFLPNFSFLLFLKTLFYYLNYKYKTVSPSLPLQM